MNVREIVEKYLGENDCDGLTTKGCYCEISDIALCGFINEECEAGHKVIGCTCGEGCAFHIVPELKKKGRCNDRK